MNNDGSRAGLSAVDSGGGGGAHQNVDRFFEICSVIPYKTPIE